MTASVSDGRMPAMCPSPSIRPIARSQAVTTRPPWLDCTRWTRAGAGGRPRRARRPAEPLIGVRPRYAPRVPRAALLVQVAAVAVVDDDGGEVDDLQAGHRLGAELGLGDDLVADDALGEQGAGAAGGGEVHGGVVLHGLLDLGRAQALADHAFEAVPHEQRRVGVHAAAGRGPGRADDVAGLGRARPHVVDDGAPQLERQLLAGLDERDEPLVGRVARLVDHAGDLHGVTGAQVLDGLVREGGRDLLDGHRSSPPSELHGLVPLRVALHVDGHRHAGDVAGHLLDEHGQRRGACRRGPAGRCRGR